MTFAYADAQRTYPSTSYLDDLCVAAAWLNWATNNQTYLMEAEAWYISLTTTTSNWNSPVANWNNQYWAATLLLYQLTGDAKVSCLHEHELAGMTCSNSALQWQASHHELPALVYKPATATRWLCGQHSGRVQRQPLACTVTRSDLCCAAALPEVEGNLQPHRCSGGTC